jgi:WD40 repeat protein
VFWADEKSTAKQNRLVLPAGQHIVVTAALEESGDCSFLDLHSRAAESLSMCPDPSGQLVAVCERLREDPASDLSTAGLAQISVYHSRSRECLRTLTFRLNARAGAPAAPLAGGKEEGGASTALGGGDSTADAAAAAQARRLHRTFAFQQASFSGDAAATYLIAYAACAGGEHGTLVLYKWKSAKVVAVQALPAGVVLTRVRINPVSHLKPDGSPAPLSALQITATGPALCRSFRPTAEGGLREVPLLHPRREAGQVFVDHVWLRSSSAVASAAAGSGSAAGAPSRLDGTGGSSIALAGALGGGSRRTRERRLVAITASGLIYVISKVESGSSGAFDAGAEGAADGPAAPPAPGVTPRLVSVQQPRGVPGEGGALGMPQAEVWELRNVLSVALPEHVLRSQVAAVQSLPGGVGASIADAGTGWGVGDRESANPLQSSGPAAANVLALKQGIIASSGLMQLQLHAVVATSRGFLVAGSHGLLAVYERADTPAGARVKAKAAAASAAQAGLAAAAAAGGPKAAAAAALAGAAAGGEGHPGQSLALLPAASDPFVCVRALMVEGGLTLRTMSLAASEDTVAVLSLQKGVCTLNLSEAEEAGGEDDSEIRMRVPLAPLLGGGTHTRAISYLAAAVSQPRLITAGADGTLRLWDYLEGRAEVLLHTSEDGGNGSGSGLADRLKVAMGATLQDGGGSTALVAKAASAAAPGVTDILAAARADASDALCVAMHPSGLLVGAGYRDRMCLYNACATSLLPWRSLPLKNVTCMAFSHGGGLLALCAGFAVQVYSTFSCELVHSMAAHTGQVRDLCWAGNDMSLASVADDGGVLLWNMRTGKRVEAYSHVVRCIKFTAVTLVCPSFTAVGTLPGAAGGAAPGPGGAGPTSARQLPGAGGAPRPVVGRDPPPPPPAAVAAAVNQAVVGVSAIVAAGRGSDGTSVLVIVSLPTGAITKVRLGPRITRLTTDHRQRLFAGTADGSVLVYRWPLQLDPATAYRASASAARQALNISMLASPVSPETGPASKPGTASSGPHLMPREQRGGGPEVGGPPPSAAAGLFLPPGSRQSMHSAVTGLGATSAAGGAGARGRRGAMGTAAPPARRNRPRHSISADSHSSVGSGARDRGLSPVAAASGAGNRRSSDATHTSDLSPTRRAGHSGPLLSPGFGVAMGGRGGAGGGRRGVVADSGRDEGDAFGLAAAREGGPGGGGVSLRGEREREGLSAAEEDEDLLSTPLAGTLAEPGRTQFRLHQGRVTGLRLSPDAHYLFTAGEEGTLFVLGVPFADVGKAGGSPRRVMRLPSSIAPDGSAVEPAGQGAWGALATASVVGLGGSGGGSTLALSGGGGGGSGSVQWVWEPSLLRAFNAGVSLLPRSSWEEAMGKVAASESLLREAREQAMRAIARANSEFAAKLSALTASTEQQLAAERHRYETLAAQHEAYVRESVAAKAAAEAASRRALAETANLYERRLAAEMNRFDGLQEEAVAVRQAAEEALGKAEVERKEQVAALLAAAAKRQAENESVIGRLGGELKKAEARHAAMLDDTDRDAEEVLSRLRARMQLAVQDEEDRTAAKTAQVSSLHKQTSQLARSVKAAEKDATALRGEVAARDLRVAQLAEQVRSLGRSLEEQALVLAERDREVAALRAERRHLENFRFVADHRLSEMEAERAPVAEHIAGLERHIEGMYGELVGKFAAGKGDAQEMRELRDKNATLGGEVRRLRVTVAEMRRRLDVVTRDIDKVARGPEGEQPAGLLFLLSKYVDPSVKATPLAWGGAPDTGGAAATGAASGATSSRSPSPPGRKAAVAGATGAGHRPPSPVDAVSLYEHRETVAELLRQQDALRRGAAAHTRHAELVASQEKKRAGSTQREGLQLLDEANALRREVVFQRRRIHDLETELAVRGGSSTGRAALGTGRGQAGMAGSRSAAALDASLPLASLGASRSSLASAGGAAVAAGKAKKMLDFDSSEALADGSSIEEPARRVPSAVVGKGSARVAR